MKREDVLNALANGLANTNSSDVLMMPPGHRPYGTTEATAQILLNQQTIMQALYYLVDHTTEQAWKNYDYTTGNVAIEVTK